ncbi:MAG: hypothetical protein AB1529_08035 [Candidatus Micrarchaeota archaeon]
MTRYVFSDLSVDWLKENSFDDEDIDKLQEILNKVESHKKKDGPLLKMPKDAGAKVSTIVSLLESITDSDGRPICFEESGLISIPDEAKSYFEEDLQLEELEMVTTKLKKVKFARRYSDPRRRGTMKENEKFGSL